MDPRHRRRAGLRQVNRLTGWLVGGAVVACGAFAGLLARPSIGTSSARTVPPPAGATTTVPTYGPQDGSSGVGDDGGAVAPLSPPVQAPSPTSGASQVTTGAS
jgi:hypothetical protein